jgi:hypothetical protein
MITSEVKEAAKAAASFGFASNISALPLEERDMT